MRAINDRSETRIAACNLCEAMCGLRITLAGDRITDIRGDEEDPFARGHICPKAIALRDVHDDPDRLRRPVRRTGSGWQETSWDEALHLVATGLAQTRARHGADAVAVYLGNPVVHSLGALTHVTPLMRMLGTRNRFSAGSVDQLPSQFVSYLLYGDQWLIPVPDIDRTSYFLVFGANPVVSNGSLMSAPGIAGRIRRLRERGGRMVLFDPRRTESAGLADEHHFIRPGTDVVLIMAMVRLILDEGPARPAGYVDGLREVRDHLEEYTPERAASITGVPANTIKRISHDFAAAPAAACYGRTGVSTQRFGALCQWGIQLLNLITGNFDRPGGTLVPSPAVDLIGSGRLDPGHYARWRSRVRGLPEFAGELPVAVLAEEIRTPGEGQVHALLTVAGNPVLSSPGGNALDQALPELDFMACVDFYINETTRHADVILPPTHLLQRDHYDLVFTMLAVRNIARYVPAPLPRPDDARHDWEIFRDLARHYRRKVRSGSLQDRSLMRLSPARIVDLALRTGPYRLSLAKLRRHPHGLDLGPLRSTMPARLQTPGKRVDAASPLLIADLARARADLLTAVPEDGLLLIGRRHLRDNNSWMHNSARLTKGRPRHELLMHPSDMAARGLTDGERVRVESRTGEVTVEVRGTDDIMPGVVSLPHGYGHARDRVALSLAATVPGVSANDLTDPEYLDDLTGTAALNGVVVTVRRPSAEPPRGPRRPHARAAVAPPVM
ncbi:molybdopterin-dependent oxidoreductase [Nonomuraea sp. SYSU D8015]|uniref:molybdopterin-dependent oxidoreductase n=1 Tax=Nonomuraea sp. SYSU D8015 TaxID=2593644 RepID=UPI0016616C96|nr:molybdopterin-dependent oxidoreductase [Nonomuraea sp. SYSU D8015]